MRVKVDRMSVTCCLLAREFELDVLESVSLPLHLCPSPLLFKSLCKSHLELLIPRNEVLKFGVVLINEGLP